MFASAYLVFLSATSQLASSPPVNGDDPKRNLLWRDEDISDTFIICAALLVAAVILGLLSGFIWLICRGLLWVYPTYTLKLWHPLLFGLLSCGIGVLLTRQYAFLAYVIIPYPLPVSLLWAGTLLGFYTGRIPKRSQQG
jgi:hypothetical protein